MTRRQALERRRHSLEETGKIIHSMQTLAFLETRKLDQRMQHQALLQAQVERAAADFLAFHPCTTCRPAAAKACLIVGSERGFCGDFNERLAEQMRDAWIRDPGCRYLAVGRRLGNALAEHPGLDAVVNGASVSEEIPEVLGRITSALQNLQLRHGDLELSALHHAPQPAGIRHLSLLPPFQELPPPSDRPFPPLLNLPPATFLLGLVEHYLLIALQGCLCASLLAENQRRVQQLEGAARHLQRRADDLQRRGARLRQEEIIEEIEVLLLGMGGGPVENAPGTFTRT